MSARMATRDLVIGLSPHGHPDARLVVAVCHAGGLGALDLARGDRLSRHALERAVASAPTPFGVRVPADCPLTPADLDAIAGERVDTVILAAGAPWRPADVGRGRVLMEVTDLPDALDAIAAGAHGVIARGDAPGGLSSFVLLQRLAGRADVTVPVWLAGDLGPRTAAAAVLGGAAGVVLDARLALLAESDLPADLMPGGAGRVVAEEFAARFGTVRSAVTEVIAAIRGVADDDPKPILSPCSPLADSLGTRLAIAQGPMTRVSDQAAFAMEVAGGGGLPFIALALSTEDQTRTILEQTATRLVGRPWGVGVLGFAPEETRSAQLRVIQEIRPTHAIIAGGRPTQAATLEAAGISAFLHVPSPVLLRQFLDAGARKFIFEGSECGGHIGPRTSFGLWESQLAVLAALPDRDITDVEVFFAGGVHDARSAAMVAAMAAPLAARGARVGVLMGTAYLFTAEAVSHGAIHPVFQREVLAAERTVLLETAPGHATRGLLSPYTESFHHHRESLRARDLSDRDVWRGLEELNIGRLRIASKGLRRAGDELVRVSHAEQLSDGLFMAGQVVALRSTVTTIERLHTSVSTEALVFHEERRALLRAEQNPTESEPAAPLDIAIVGMACVFPGAPDLPTFWSNVLAGTDAVTEVPPQRWDVDTYYSPDATGRAAEGRTPSKWGGFLPPIPFDPLRYGIPPAALASIEPTQLLSLEVARRALADAGYPSSGVDHSRTSVVFGAEAGSDQSNAGVLRNVLPAYLGHLPAALDEQLPALTEDTFPGVLANVIAGRIANRLDLGGANYTVDAACASSLAAVDVACKELTLGTSDLVLCGGVDLHNGIHDYLLFSSVHALSPTGRSATFDATADGIALGEGVACVVLKRAADALRDGDRVYAVIRGVGSASDGRALGLTAPRPEGQGSALRRAYRNAGISPAEVGLIEAHGTGTVVGDRTELAVLNSLFTEAGAPGGCALGSVKSQIGHTKCAAGLAGLIKTSMALYTGVRPPTIHLDRPNQAWEGPGGPFAFYTEASPWPVPAARRVAGVSAFGFGGTNFHVVLRAHEHAEPRHTYDAWPAELFVFRGEDIAAVHGEARRLLDLVAVNEERGRPWRLRDLAATASRRFQAGTGSLRAAIVATDLDGLADLAGRLLAGEHTPTAGVFSPKAENSLGKVAFLFPGQGSQRPGALADLFVAFPELHHYLRAGGRWADLLHPPKAFDADAVRAQQEQVRDTRVAQPILGVTGLAVDHLLRQLGVRPDMVAGHSYGELVALCAAGAFDTETLLALSAARATAILAAVGDDPGAMAAVSASVDEVAKVLVGVGLAGVVVIANHNGPRQVVISGPTSAIARAVEAARGAGLASTNLPVACAFHSPLLASADAALAAELAGRVVREPELPVWANRTASVYAGTPADVRAELAAQVCAPVRFAEQIEAMYSDGARVFIEAGPGRVLSGLVADILGDRPHLVVACDGRPGGGQRGFLEALAHLVTAGIPIRTGWLFAGRDIRDVSTTNPTLVPGWTVDGHLVRTRDGATVPGGLTPARRVEVAMTRDDRYPAGNGRPDPGVLLEEYLRVSRELIAAQRDVMLTYLAAGGGGSDPNRAAMPAVASPAAELTRPAPLPSAVPGRTHGPASGSPPGSGATPVAVDLTPDGVAEMVRAVIAERTGYPVDMIEPELDLEADLSVDSIKRAEIAGELAARLGIAPRAGQLDDTELDALTRMRTAGEIAAWLVGKSAAPTVPQDVLAPERRPAATVTRPVEVSAPRRLEWRWVDAPVAAADRESPDALRGKTFVVLGRVAPLVREVSALLEDLGVVVVSDEAWREHPGSVDGVLHLDALHGSDQPMFPTALMVFQDIVRRAPRWLIAAWPAVSPDGIQAVGLRGFMRSVAREYPGIEVRAVGVDPAADPAEVARLLVAEVCVRDGSVVVVREGGARYRPEATEVTLDTPEGDVRAALGALGLNRESVVVVVGGARGITAQVALAMAGSGCRVELVGRTVLAGVAEPPDVAAATDRNALRAALIATGMRSPAAVERAVARVLAEREVNATLAQLRAMGCQVRYHALDVRDPDATDQLLKEIYSEHGGIDGVIHAAGVIEDRLLVDKDPVSFARVFGTKVDGARNLLSGLAALPGLPRFTVLFGSVAAVAGNRGQADYAAANDAVEELGRRWSASTGARCLTIHWGPWAATGTHAGMVTPELQREYARRGVALLDPECGVQELMRELAWGDPAVTTVVYTASGW